MKIYEDMRNVGYKRRQWLNLIRARIKLVEVNLKVNFKRNHKGTRFITLAKSSKVELLITGDKKLSEMIELEKTELEKTVILYQELL